jgi:uncharacterized protein (DUF1800 family)
MLVPLGACDQEERRFEQAVLDRIGYGPNPWSLARIHELGIAGYISEQLDPSALDDSALEAELGSLYPAINMSYYNLRNIYNEYVTPNQSEPRFELGQAKLLRAIYSKHQLEQVLTDFWFNHFNVDGNIVPWTVVTYERDAIRPYVFGRFRDMLRATTGHAAMLEYLNNNVNFKPGFVLNSRVYGPNENFAREILELHTVGIGAGYTLTDIQQVARAFTGWSTVRDYLIYPTDLGFVYLDAGHDTGAKSIMGQLQIPAGGDISNGEAVIDFLSRHPATADHLSRELCQRFLSEPPPEPLVQRAKQTFLATDGDLREVMRTILTSKEFMLGVGFRTRVKRPLVYMASLARAVGVADDATFARLGMSTLTEMGEHLYEAAPPTGYPETSVPWAGQGAFLSRVNAAYRAASGMWGFAPLAPSSTDGAALVDELTARFFRDSVSSATRSGVVAMLAQLPAWSHQKEAAATLLASPEFMKH